MRLETMRRPKSNIKTIGIPVTSSAKIETNHIGKPEELIKSVKSIPGKCTASAIPTESKLIKNPISMTILRMINNIPIVLKINLKKSKIRSPIVSKKERDFDWIFFPKSLSVPELTLSLTRSRLSLTLPNSSFTFFSILVIERPARIAKCLDHRCKYKKFT